jgi:hypothetical protein
MGAVLWVEAGHVDLLDFAETLYSFQESGLAFNRRHCLEQCLLPLAFSFKLDPLSEQSKERLAENTRYVMERTHCKH